eukprot:4747422-Pleurochrysis_carterae.AAC.1
MAGGAGSFAAGGGSAIEGTGIVVEAVVGGDAGLEFCDAVSALRLRARRGSSDPGGRPSVDATSIPPMSLTPPLGECASYVDSGGSRDFATTLPVLRLQE